MKILIYIWRAIVSFFKTFFTFLDSIKMVLIYPLLSIASTIFTFVIVVLIQPIISNLPGFLGNGFIQTIIGAIIFVLLYLVLFNERINRNLNYDYKRYLISVGGAVLFWIIPAVLFKRQGEFFGATLADEYVDYLSAFDSALTFFYLTIFSPHFWIATITKEYVFSVGAGMIINGIIFIVLAIRNVNDLGGDKKI